MATDADWGGDTSPSLPAPLLKRKHISFGGFCFTDTGITHDLSAADVEGLRVPPFAPAFPLRNSR